MKKLLVILALLLFVSSAILASCEGSTGNVSEDDTSDALEESSDVSSDTSKDDSETESSKDTESTESSAPESSQKPESSAPDVSQPDKDNDDSALTVTACSFADKPYFALIGKCAEGATVTGETDGETVVTRSYKGLYSLRLKCTGKSVRVKITQTVDGVAVGGVLEYTATPVTPSKDMWPVVAGKDMQFFFQKMLPDFQGTNLPDEQSLSDLTNRVSSRTAQLKSINPNAEIIYLLVPSSMTVYPELVPDIYTPAATTKLDKVSEALRNGGATVIDLKSAFAQHKNDDMTIYYKLDSHWTDYGAFVAYTELFNHISKQFPDAKPRSIDDFNWYGKDYQSGDMSYYLGMSKYNIREYAHYRTFRIDVPYSATYVERYVSYDKLTYSDEVTYERTLTTNNKSLPKTIVMRDSYSTQMYDILAERCYRTYYSGMWNYTWDNSQINRVKPDYVIYLVAEWNLDSIIYG